MPERSGILGQLAARLPQPKGERVFVSANPSVNLLNRCNASCAVCYEDSNHKKMPDFTPEEVDAVLKDISRNCPEDKRMVHYMGGEPFLELDLLYGSIESATRYGFIVNVATNGFWGNDYENARRIAARIDSIALQWFSLFLSCDAVHNCQKILDVGNLANIISIFMHEYPERMFVVLASLCFKDQDCLHGLAEALSGNEDVEFRFLNDSLCVWTGHGFSPVMDVHYMRPNLSGRYAPGLSSLLGCKKLSPGDVLRSEPFNPCFAVGINRQVYINTNFVSGSILPIGDVSLGSRRIFDIANADPIAVSLIKHGYSEIYPILRELFDVDTWIRNLYAPSDLLLWLDTDDPFEALIKHNFTGN